ncbi:MAG: hypothetical protein IJX38_02835 [Clostridia bacterium]|nr:hypothetical protein [Clostridia bacterium]
MLDINFNFDKHLGKIKPMHGVGQAPIMGLNDKMFHYLGEAGIPYSRLHDTGGSFGGNLYVDIHNIFRDFDADEYSEASYDFAFTDWLLVALIKQGCEPIFRLGETIENYHYVKAYRIFPPKDYRKWAVICEHIIRHYNEGWADGFHMGIKYWEIWNEPDNGRDDTENQMWHGTAEQFYELYTVTAKHLRSVFGDSIMIGGYATCGFRHILSDPKRFGMDYEAVDDELFASGRSAYFIEFFDGFFEYIKKHGAPIDFFSWHSYLSTERTMLCARYLERRLDELGYGDLELQLNEWNNVCEDRGDPLASQEQAVRERGSGMAAAKCAAMMCALQKTRTRILCYYDARVGVSIYGGVFNPLTLKPFPLYYAFKAFNELYRLGEMVECSHADGNGIYVLAAAADGQRAVLIANESDTDARIKTNLDSSMSAYLISDTKELTPEDIDASEFTVPSGSVLLLKA